MGEGGRAGGGARGEGSQGRSAGVRVGGGFSSGPRAGGFVGAVRHAGGGGSTGGALDEFLLLDEDAMFVFTLEVLDTLHRPIVLTWEVVYKSIQRSTDMHRANNTYTIVYKSLLEYTKVY